MNSPSAQSSLPLQLQTVDQRRPKVPFRSKWLGVDLDRTLVKQPTEGGTANEQPISAEQPTASVANSRPEEAQGAIQIEMAGRGPRPDTGKAANRRRHSQ